MKKNIEKSGFKAEMNCDNGVRVNVDLQILVFEEEGTSIFYCPALDLNGYGNNEEEALSSFKLVLTEYFDYTIKKNTLREDLKKYGWKIPKSKFKAMIPPDLSKMLRDNEEFVDVFNHKEYRKINMPVEMPVFA